MESKRRGFKKSTTVVMSMYHAPKPSSCVQYSNTVKPTTSASTAFMEHSTEKKHYSCTDTGNDVVSYGHVEQYNYDDEAIDARAESYISGVLQRFSLERLE